MGRVGSDLGHLERAGVVDGRASLGGDRHVHPRVERNSPLVSLGVAHLQAHDRIGIRVESGVARREVQIGRGDVLCRAVGLAAGDGEGRHVLREGPAQEAAVGHLDVARLDPVLVADRPGPSPVIVDIDVADVVGDDDVDPGRGGDRRAEEWPGLIQVEDHVPGVLVDGDRLAAGVEGVGPPGDVLALERPAADGRAVGGEPPGEAERAAGLGDARVAGRRGRRIRRDGPRGDAQGGVDLVVVDETVVRGVLLGGDIPMIRQERPIGSVGHAGVDNWPARSTPAGWSPSRWSCPAGRAPKT